MKTDIFNAAAHAQAQRSSRKWLDKTLDKVFAEATARSPDKPALVAFRADRTGQSRRIAYRELDVLVGRAAAGLRDLGVGRGDMVAVQLPNWWEFVVTTLACARLHAVINPLIPIFREHELRFMLEFSGAKVFIVPKVFREFDHAAMAAALKLQIPSLEHVVVVDGVGADSFEELLHRGEGGEIGTQASSDTQAGDLSLLMFTSGTTGQPKAVMHCDNTLIAGADALARRVELTADEVLLCCAPIGHMTGFIAVMLQSLRLGATLVLQDVWEARRAVQIIADEGVSYTVVSTPFLSDICDRVAAGDPKPQRMKKLMCGGAPIPPILVERASRTLGIQVLSLWGMTESLGSTVTDPARAADKSATSDGRALEGVAVRVVDDAGRSLEPGVTGRLEVRGALMFLGYFKRPDIVTFDGDGWFDTGDLAYMDAEGFIRINGRTKDVLIRGGENVPVFEIESVLHRHPAVLSTALVGYPDARLGERGCAFVELRPGASFDLGIMQAWMAENKVAKQYWPERVEVLPQLPRTPSGKIKKFVLSKQALPFGQG